MRLTRKTTSRVRTRAARHSGSDGTAGEPVTQAQGLQQSAMHGAAHCMPLALPPEIARIMSAQGICTYPQCTLQTRCCHPMLVNLMWGRICIPCALMCAEAALSSQLRVDGHP